MNGRSLSLRVEDDPILFFSNCQDAALWHVAWAKKQKRKEVEQ